MSFIYSNANKYVCSVCNLFIYFLSRRANERKRTTIENCMRLNEITSAVWQDENVKQPLKEITC